uniref:leucine-rich repeat and guanylate kinase domain-containing protein isoform X2 n=1 Tax=Solea senegalensis TaxID=28829 RepID=UPI001CD89DE6|nr:leucine-rich repeat and guanylate kinase domain-containing protein isoform X2 [Solea senegalensis]
MKKTTKPEFSSAVSPEPLTDAAASAQAPSTDKPEGNRAMEVKQKTLRRKSGKEVNPKGKETTSPGEFSSAVSPEPLADAPSSDTPEENRDMEMKQETSRQKSGEGEGEGGEKEEEVNPNNRETGQEFSSAVSPEPLADAAASTEAPSSDKPEENKDKENGVLTAELISRRISQMGRFGIGLQHLYHHLALPNYNLSDVSILCSYVHLQKLELPHNKIKDLSCVSHMPYLFILDASHNHISDFFGFQPPKNLKVANFSYNRMTKMKDLSAYLCLTKLDLDYNGFSEISGLEQCTMLTHLSLAHNRISRISGLYNLPLSHLCLRGNQLERIEGLETIKSLQFLDLSLNRIRSLSGLQNLCILSSLNLKKNLISEIKECKHIHELSLLRDLNLLQNPVQEQQDYRLSVVFLLQHLTMLDQEKVTAEEKVSSVNKYDPPIEVVAARDHMTHLVYQLMQPQMLYDSTLPSADSPYPILVLTGPQGCGKRELAHRLCQDLNECFGYGICHTTRGPYFGEENGIDYHFVSEEDFQNMIHMGKFIQTMHYGGHRYGLTRDAIEEVARDGLACCVHMELEGVLSLKNSFFEPRYVLLLPTDVEKYTGHLKSRSIYEPAQIDVAVSRIDLYTNTIEQQPGFFDNVIPCDDWEEVYPTLRQIVKEYLLSEELKGENNNRADDASTAHEPDEKPPSPLSTLMSHFSATLDPSDPAHANYFTRIQAELSPQKNPTELASIRRREQLVREAVMGKSPGVYSLLFKSSTQNAPSSQQNSDSQHLEESRETHTKSSGSEESHASTALSVPTSAAAFEEQVNGSALGHAVETPKDHLESDQSANTSRADSDHLAAVASSPSSDRRPGSNMKPLLPPIPAGRKTPLVPSMSPSPRGSPNTAATEEGQTNTEQ